MSISVLWPPITESRYIDEIFLLPTQGCISLCICKDQQQRLADEWSRMAAVIHTACGFYGDKAVLSETLNMLTFFKYYKRYIPILNLFLDLAWSK